MTDPKEVFGKWMDFIDESMLLRYRNMLLQCTLNNVPIEPSPERVFSCFRHTKAEDLKVVILGQDPYFDGSATGIAFANDFTKTGIKKISPSLNVIMQSVISLSDNPKSVIFDPTLESWAKQGILLLNSALTVRRGEPGSHMKAWKPFIERLLVAISGKTNACFLLLGKTAWAFKDCIFDNGRGVFMEYHPAYYARNNTPMPNTVWKNMIGYVQENYGVTLKLYE
jgi:uracil-DNA glycosylase